MHAAEAIKGADWVDVVLHNRGAGGPAVADRLMQIVDRRLFQLEWFIGSMAHRCDPFR
jgi:hypothetical protein